MVLWESFARHASPIPYAPSCSRCVSPSVQRRDPSGSLLIQGAFVNDKSNQPPAKPLPAILVYGTPSGPALTQASWFRAEDMEAVKAAGKALKFSVIELHTDADRT